MIKFFRKIRQNLLSEGKTGKYLKYAIGEIVLVVIGILIALQINNWNEAKKDQVRTYSLLENLSKEIEQDSIYFNNVYRVEKNIFLYSAELLFNAHSNPDFVIENDSIFGMAFRFAPFTPAIKYSNNAYKELTTSGHLNKITSKTLKKNLNKYYSQIEFLKTYAEEGNRAIDRLIEELANYYVIIPVKNSESKNVSTFSGATEDGFYTKYDIAAFRQHKSLNPDLFEMIDKHKDRLGAIENIKRLGQNIQKEIRSQTRTR